MKKSDLLINGPKNSQRIFIFAHGAGAPMDSDWMNELTDYLVSENIKVIRFEFPYMAERRLSGKKRPPNTQKVLFETWKQVIELIGNPRDIYIGGKSMGGRMASLLADELKVKGLICFGFPFYAPGKSFGDRSEQFSKMKVQALILQGERDPMGDKAGIRKFKPSSKVKLKWVTDGDHSLKPRKKSGLTLESNLSFAAKEVAKFIK